MAKSLSVRLRTRCLWVRVPLQSLKISDIASVSSKEFLNIQANVECGFLPKCVGYMTKIYSQMHRTYKYLQHSSIIWPVSPSGWLFVYELNCCGLESIWSHLNFKYFTCFEQGVPWHSGEYRVSIHSEMRTWHDKIIHQMHRITKYSQHGSVIWAIWPGRWVLVYELSGFGFESRCSHINFR